MLTKNFGEMLGIGITDTLRHLRQRFPSLHQAASLFDPKFLQKCLDRHARILMEKAAQVLGCVAKLTADPAQG